MRFDPYRDGVSQGLLTTFMRCRQEAHLQIGGFVPLRTSQALQFGTLGHLVLEDIYGRLKRQPTDKEVLKSIRNAVESLKEELGGRFSAEELEFMEMNILLLEAVMPEYFKFWQKDFTKFKWAELEQKFSVPSPVAGVNLVGRIDGAFWLKAKDLWSFESKTKGQINEEDISNTLSFDFQNGFYQRALNHKYGQRPRGSLYNIIRRPAHRLGKNETMPKFKARVQEEVRKDPEHFFVRFEVAVPKTDADRFEQELKVVLEEFVAWWKGDIKTYRNTSACIQRFGPCRFLPICSNNEFSLFRKRDVMYPELERP